MKKTILLIVIVIALVCCTNNQITITKQDTRIALQADKLNVVKRTDTMVIFESTCRSCAYEQSTNFGISDSNGIIKLHDIITADNNSDNMNGGSISKTLELVPLKTGITTFKLYKFWKHEHTAADSAKFVTYSIEVKN